MFDNYYYGEFFEKKSENGIDSFEKISKKNISELEVISKRAVVFYLQHGFCPFPFTLYEGIYQCGIGDDIKDYYALLKHSENECLVGGRFPFESRESTGASMPSTKVLLEKLCDAINKGVENRSSISLMMSSGKDSVALALGLAELGYHSKVTAYTIEENSEGEANAARHFCEKLGIKHKTIRFSHNLKSSKKILENLFKKVAQPSGDPVSINYMLSLYEAGIEGDLILDGMGNDVYFGFIPSRLDVFRSKIPYFMRFIGKLPAIKNDFIPQLVAKSKPERLFGSAFWPCPSEIERITGINFDARRYWEEYESSIKCPDLMDFRAYFAGKHLDINRSALKAVAAAEANDNEVYFPWMDKGLASYCFNLPIHSKFDIHSKKNKILLRDLLDEKLSYSNVSPSKREYEFSITKFYDVDEMNFDEIIFDESFVKDKNIAKDVYVKCFSKTKRDHRLLVPLNAFYILSLWMNSRSLVV